MKEANYSLLTSESVPVAFRNLKLWQYQVLQLKFENPKIKNKECAAVVQKTEPQICEFFKSDYFKNAVVEYGKSRLFNLIPKALKTVEEVMDDNNAHAKLNAALKILEDSGILTKETIQRFFNQINTQINVASFDLKSKSVKELSEMLISQIRGFSESQRSS